MVFITLCTGWILKKRTRKLVVLQKCQKSEIGGKSVYIPPLTPDQPPFKGGRYLTWEVPIVQRVINNPTQLSGRGFPYIVCIKVVFCHNFTFFGCSQMEAGPRSLNM